MHYDPEQVAPADFDLHGWKQIADFLRMSVTTVKKMAARAENALPHFPCGPRIVYAKRADVLAWWRRRASEAA